MKFFFCNLRAMLTYVKATWSNIAVSCICIVTVKTISVACLRRNESDSFKSNWNARIEAGFDLNQEDMIKFHIWPTGTIPYYIDDVSFDKVSRDRIRVFLNGVNRLSILRFVEIPRPPEDDYTRWVIFINRKGLLRCADHPFNSFTNEGVQRVVLGNHCMNSDENLADVVLSLVGVPPQHNSPDRDESVDVMENNIIPDKLYLFKKLEDNEWLFHNLTYDFESAGHYEPFKHTSNGQVTVQRKQSDYYFIFIFGPPPPKLKENGFSSQDILKIAMIYNYVVRNRETPAPECSQIFAPGSKLPDNYPQHTNFKTEPRPKPSRYLGESKKEQVNSMEESNTGEINNDEHMIDENEMNYDDKMNDSENSDNKNKEYDENYNGCDENKENGKKININDGHNYYEEDDYYPKDNKEDHNDSENEKNEQKVNADYDISGYNDNELNNNSKNTNNKENDHDDGKREDKQNKTDNMNKCNEVIDREGNKLNKNNEFTRNIISTTRKNNRMPLAHKVYNSKKYKLLGQSDYETSDEDKNKYLHEKNRIK